ncbi:mucin-5AC isoform X5 [Procambarus clarkii]|uniref:mucin-5AC isoform X5 n=1 Tax=Procambarus clarkii TaxID=6728 RepID=UPI001E677D83|nr:uncharacterized protein LOC123758019 isoform X5 [Procambarus clarkii]
MSAAAGASDPLPGCLDADAAYVCTALAPSCFLIQKVSAGGGTVLNPEASVFHLPATLHASNMPPSPTLTPTTTTHPPTINGFHSHVYPFMNGDVAKQYCGVCPPTPDTPGPMAVESPVEATAASSPNTLPVEGGTTAGQPPGKTAISPITTEEMAAAQSNEQEGSATACIPLGSMQQNGEVSPESSRSSASPLPASLPTPPLSNSSVPEESEKKEQSFENKSKEHLSSSETQGTQTTPAQTPTPSTPAVTPPAQPQQSIQQTQPLSRDQIKQHVAQQVEYFFSRENLSNDPYLISQMDSDQYVPVFILANCSQFKNITKDHSIIVEALKESPFVQLDEENNRVRPNYKRCIVILREIPESTPVDEIESMFKSDECPKVVSCEFVHNSSWYVTFESDEDAQKAYWFLRGVVKTFKGNPILARIKTKPMSRLGCLSVLPSYGNKGGEGKEGQAPPSTPGSAGLPGGPGTQAPSNNYNNPGYQRFMYSTPTSVNNSSYSYSYTTPTTPMPTAFFYPNMMQWTPPGFDINSFLQYNGLSPQAAYKPPASHNLRYPGRRNSKHRDGRFDKSDTRHPSGVGQGNSGGSSNHGIHPGHYHANPRPHPSNHRPHAAQSPQSSQRVTQAPPTNPGAPTPPPPPPPPPPPQPSTSISAVAGGSNHDSFAHSDFSIASQSNLYTSFSPPMPTPPVIHTEKKEVVTVCKTTNTNSTLPVSSQSLGQASTSISGPQSSNTSMLNSSTTETDSIAVASSISPAVSSAVTTSCSNSQPLNQQMHPHIQHHQPPVHRHNHQYQHVPPQHLGPPPHRNNYGNDHYHHHPPHHLQRDPQQSRQFFENWYYHRPRGVRRRPRGREEEAAMAGGGRGGMPQRGGLSQSPNAESIKPGASQQEMTPLPPPPPQFDLEAAAFPPLPGSDEQVPVAEEKRPPEPMTSAWGSDTQRFSDVMKGTAKPRPTSQSSSDKELPLEPTTPTTSNSPSPSATITASPTVTPIQALAAAAAAAVAAATPQASQAPCSLTTLPPNSLNTTSIALSTSSSNTSTCTTAPTLLPTTTLSNTNVSNSNSSSNKVETRQIPRDQRGARDERRPGANGGPRGERRDYGRDHPREYQRDHQREAVRCTGGRDRDHRIVRESNSRAGKENRPVPSRPWKEEKVDADGWITKGPKESRHREMNRDQWERSEVRDTRTQHLVNGDSSPPSSPKPQKTDIKTSSEECSVEETKVTTIQPLNNNDGEHKTSWAKMALASKDEMERLAAELKEKEEQEKIKKQRLSTRPQPKAQEKVLIARERDGKTMRRDGPPRENRLSGERGTTLFRPRDSARPKSPK